MTEQNFENAMKKLEEIVQNLEKGDLVLEDSLKNFEEGMVLIKFASNKLEEVEKKVRMLVQNSEGKNVQVPFEPEK